MIDIGPELANVLTWGITVALVIGVSYLGVAVFARLLDG